jgi:hypothetical protein
LGGRSGERATYQRLKSIFYWNKMHRQVKEYVKSCPICQKNKSEHTPYPGLLEQLPVPDMAWTHISMDFVEGLPKSNKDVILVVVDRFTKYAHFLTLSHPFTVQDVITLFLEIIFKLHGLPSAIVTDRDRNHYGKLCSSHWASIFISVLLIILKLMARLKELINAYNTSYHTSSNLTAFQALYGFPPPLVAEVVLPDCPDDGGRNILQNRQLANQLIKDNLVKAQARIKHQVDKHRTERQLEVSDMVYLKVQPYRHSSLSIHKSLKLHSKYYGPFRILE